MSNILKTLAAGSASEPTDEYFNQTTLLLHGDGTNGAQNNTFLDSSTNNFTITRNGNTTQGTFSPFSVAEGQWSNYFAGSQRISAPANAAFQMGLGDFTIEAWVFVNSTVGDQVVVDGRASNGNFTDCFSFTIDDGELTAYTNGITNLTGSVPTNEWVHVALTRQSGTLKGWINGTQTGATADWSAVNINNAGCQATIGSVVGGTAASLVGNISNVRVVKGTAVYTAAFTPSTTPLTAISGTSLLTCQSNRFVDNSSNNFAITISGTPSVQPFSPFLPTAAYDASVNGGSGYMDITGDNLVTPTNTAFQLGSGNFTIEWWYYWTQERNPAYLFRTDNGTAVSGLMLYYNGTNFVAYGSTTGSSWDIWNGDTVANFSRMQNRWVHLALVRNGTSFKWYVDGVAVTTGTATSSAINQTANLFTINRIDGQGGYWANFRYVKGTAIYTSDFTPPTSQLTAVSGTELLLNFTNAGILDNTGKNNLETVADCAINTTTKKYGTGSMEFDGTGDWLTMPNSPNLQFGSGDFTVEFWWYPNATTDQNLVSKWGSGTEWILQWRTAGYFRWAANGSVVRDANYSLSTGAWIHVAVSCAATNLRIFVDGTQIGTTATQSAITATTEPLTVGAGQISSSPLPVNGFIDDLRITKGVARYTSNFTVPDKAFPDQ